MGPQRKEILFSVGGKGSLKPPGRGEDIFLPIHLVLVFPPPPDKK